MTKKGQGEHAVIGRALPVFYFIGKVRSMRQNPRGDALAPLRQALRTTHIRKMAAAAADLLPPLPAPSGQLSAKGAKM